MTPLDYADHEVLLMESIRKRWGALIDDQCHNSSVRPNFLAALIANESGGDPAARRYERSAFTAILETCAGFRTDYQKVTAPQFLAFIDAGSFSSCLTRTVQLATSQGLTQIMGWHCIEKKRDFGVFATPAGQLRLTLDLLTDFATVNDLDLTTEYEQLLRCWNSGRPDGATYDPQYVPKGLARAAAYSQLVAAAAEAPVSVPIIVNDSANGGKVNGH